MDLTDKELLEFAAKAYGIEFVWDPDDPGYMWTARNGERVWSAWDPRRYSGDALDLAVRLGLNISIWGGFVYVNRPGVGPANAHEDFGPDGDRHAATRRAITRAAAEIGRAMP